MRSCPFRSMLLLLLWKGFSKATPISGSNYKKNTSSKAQNTRPRSYGILPFSIGLVNDVQLMQGLQERKCD